VLLLGACANFARALSYPSWGQLPSEVSTCEYWFPPPLGVARYCHRSDPFASCDSDWSPSPSANQQIERADMAGENARALHSDM